MNLQNAKRIHYFKIHGSIVKEPPHQQCLNVLCEIDAPSFTPNRLMFETRNAVRNRVYGKFHTCFQHSPKVIVTRDTY